MRIELEMIQKIEQYLMGTLAPNDKAAFESEMASDAALRRNVELQQSITEGIRRIGLKTSAKNAYSTYKLQAFLIKLVVIAVIATGVTFGTLALLNSNESPGIPVEYNEDAFQFPENDSLSADANQYLEQEFFSIKINEDTLIETKDGIVLYIPANAFNTTEQQVDLLVQGAITPDAILQAGLSTVTSDGEALETGGMFYIDAYVNGQRVDLLKELTVDVPTSDKKPGMQLYQGEKTSDGEIVWNNPKPIESFLTPVEITSLDFYPPCYEEELNLMGYSDKGFMDSLYYSFACTETTVPGFAPVEDNDFILRDGRLLFQQNCSSCHLEDRDMTGPKLTGARERWIENSSEENFYAFIKNSGAVIAAGDKYAKQLFETWKTVQPAQPVSNEQIDAIFYWVEFKAQGIAPVNSKWNPRNRNVDYLAVFTGPGPDSAISYCPGINPASIKAIWNPAFNNTILATKEFGERMPWIHQSCNNAVLELYINNLDKPLSSIDSMALPYLSGDVREKFLDFARRGDGRVELSNEASKKLAQHYEEKRKAYAEALTKTQQQFWEDQAKLDEQNRQQQQSSDNRNSMNTADVFQQEFKKNLCKVYDELDLDKDCSAPFVPQATFTVTVTNLGWNNIDRPVYEATASRTTATISANGKSSTLTYSEWSATLPDFRKYDRIHVYNIPVEFNSYVKLPGYNGTYTYKLNADIQYKTVVLAWTADGIYFYGDLTTAGDHIITLKKVTDDEWRNNIRQSLLPLANMNAELDYIDYAQKDQKRINSNREKTALRSKIEPVVFPCGQISDSTAGVILPL